MPNYTIHFDTNISLAVDVFVDEEPGDPELEEERAGDKAWKLAEEFLQTVSATTPASAPTPLSTASATSRPR